MGTLPAPVPGRRGLRGAACGPGEVAAAAGADPTPHTPPPPPTPGRRPRSAPLAPFRSPPARVGAGASKFAPFQVRALSLSASSSVTGFPVPGALRRLRKKRGRALGGGGRESGSICRSPVCGSSGLGSPVARAAPRNGGRTLIPGRRGVGEGVHPLPPEFLHLGSRINKRSGGGSLSYPVVNTSPLRALWPQRDT